MKTLPTNMDLSQVPCSQLSGVGKKIAEKLAILDIHCVQDLLFHLPTRYLDRTRLTPIRNCIPGNYVVIEGEIESASTPTGGKTRLLCNLNDGTGKVHLRFFYVSTFQRREMRIGSRLRCFGEVRRGHLGLEMIHPEYRFITNETTPLAVEENLTPIYPTTEGMSQHTWRKLTEQALHLVTNGGTMQEIVPESILKKFSFSSLKGALHYVHRPPPDAPVDLLLESKHSSQQRLVFEELLAHRLSLLQLKNLFQGQIAVPLKKSEELTRTFLTHLPFQLTQAQKKVAQEIYQNLNQPHPMLRLVQGDVGSGKTVVAALAILQAIENGYQACILAPTEILAEQHFRTFKMWFEPLNIKVAFMSGQMKMSARKASLPAIANGDIQLIIGTHAVFQKEVEFAKLVLIVVDEQHRFGVQQRAALREKGFYENKFPHQLIMTATPIPRTLAMSAYADLDYSTIDELPPGRTPVTTVVISNARRDEVLARIREACAKGRQTYWVCTLIEESEIVQCTAAEKTAEELREVFNDLKIGLIHGRMKTQEKDEVMLAFKKAEIHLLVATTVIEVGVDVPNASLMVIENAERLGLAQLHQLRGRVGRGAVASHCVLMYQHPLSSFAKERLGVMRETTDGFKIAQRDLELRGPGEVLGTRQTGLVSLRIADLIRDSHLISAVQEAAQVLQNDYCHLIEPLIKRWVGTKDKYACV